MDQVEAGWGCWGLDAGMLGLGGIGLAVQTLSSLSRFSGFWEWPARWEWELRGCAYRRVGLRRLFLWREGCMLDKLPFPIQ